MKLVPAGAPVHSLEEYRAAGWTDAQLIDAGLFEAAEVPAVVPYVQEITLRYARPDGAHFTAEPKPTKVPARPAMPNPFGVTDLAVVQATYDEARHAARKADGGYSFEAQLLEFATQMARRL